MIAKTASSVITVPLWRAAHGRTGDKGNRANISVIAWTAELYPLLVQQVTEAAVAARVRAPPARRACSASSCRTCRR